QLAVFQKTFTLGPNPSGTIYVAVDDFAEVRVNGTVVGTTGSIGDVSAARAAQSNLMFFDLTRYLAEGENTLAIVAQNGPAAFTGGACSPCSYATNGAGVVFGGALQYLPNKGQDGAAGSAADASESGDDSADSGRGGSGGADAVAGDSRQE